MKKRRGISLVALIITIIVLIILTATVIAVFKDGGIIDKAKESTFRNDITVFREELLQYVLNKQAETLNTFDKTTLTKTKYNEIKEIINSFTQKYENKVIIYKGEIAVDITKLDEKETEWAEALNLSELSSGISNGIIPSEAKTITNYRIYGNSVQDGTPTPANPVEVLSLGEISRNLFDKNNLGGMGYIDGNGNVGANNDWRYSNYIEVNGNTAYTFSGVNYVGEAGYYAWYDENKIFISSFLNVLGAQTKTSPSTARYLRVCFRFDKGTRDTLQVEIGSTATEYRYVNIVSSGKNLSTINEIEAGTLQYSALNVPSLVSDFNSLPIGTDVVISYDVVCNGTLDISAGRVYIVFSDGSTQGTENRFTKTSKTAILIYLYGGKQSDSTYTKFSNIQMEIGTTKTTYEPYQAPITTTIDLTGHEPLRKIGDVADCIDYENKKIIRNIGKIDLGTLNWRISSGTYVTEFTDIKSGGDQLVLCERYTQMPYSSVRPTTEYAIANSPWSAMAIWINDIRYSSAEDFKLSLSGLYLYYPLKTPIEESITLPRLPDNTKEVQVISNGNIVPSNIEIEYYM